MTALISWPAVKLLPGKNQCGGVDPIVLIALFGLCGWIETQSPCGRMNTSSGHCD